VVRVIGLTGGIGSGKSSVARIFEELGAEVVDADQLARQVVAPGEPALKDVAAAFGPGVILADGTLDRPKLASIIFRDEVARATLNAITHPRIRSRMLAEVESRRRRPGLLVLDIPLLFEGDPPKEIESSVVVWVDRATQLRRLVERDGLSLEEASRRIAAQMPLDAKRERADEVIDNSRSLEETRAQVVRLYRRWLEAASD
jgi:dephospho-CoA kinase